MKAVLLLVLFCLGSTWAGNFFTTTNWYKAMGWCKHGGSQLFIGDFNGDRRSDMLCHDHKGNTWVALANGHGQFTGTTWHNNRNFKWCGHAGSRLLVGDFNGDGRTDIMCHDRIGRLWMLFASASGSFLRRHGWHNAKFRWCSHNGAKLYVGDFNGDGRDDILCHDTLGKKWIASALPGGAGFRGVWHKAMGWCRRKGAELHIADFNGDGRDDMLCHDKAGNKWVALATCTGVFTTTSWQGLAGWCTGSGAHLLTGHFNDDVRTDMLCHQSHTGKKWIALARRDSRHLFVKTDWYKNMGWCGATGQLFLGDFNGDGKDDLLCHEPHSGKKWIAHNHHQL